MNALGRLIPPDFEHVAKFPLTELPTPPTQVPVAIGVNWYTNFDAPIEADGLYTIRAGSLGTIRGGHCVCLEPAPVAEEDLPQRWWSFYNQGAEGACEGFGHARMQSLTHRLTFDAFWLYHQAQAIDGITGKHEGTTNRAALEVLRTKGLRLASGAVAADNGAIGAGNLAYGIKAYRWATSADDILAVLGTPQLDYVTVLNSWGKQDYPHRVRMPATVLDRLLREGGEAGVATES